jgi:hypothetical protein
LGFNLRNDRCWGNPWRSVALPRGGWGDPGSEREGVENFDFEADLTYKFQQILKTIGECPPTVPVAIVPDANGEWSAVISPRLRREYPDCVKRIEAVERRLRGIYALDRK